MCWACWVPVQALWVLLLVGGKHPLQLRAGLAGRVAAASDGSHQKQVTTDALVSTSVL